MTMLTVSVVCTGNICRSPMAEVILRDLLDQEGLEDQVRVVSAGTGGWHIGQPPDTRALAELRERGHDGSRLRAAQFQAADFDDVDLVLALDRGHERQLRSLAATPRDAEKIRLIRSFDPAAREAGALEVDDPYYGDERGFTDTYDELLPACRGVVRELRERLAAVRP